MNGYEFRGNDAGHNQGYEDEDMPDAVSTSVPTGPSITFRNAFSFPNTLEGAHTAIYEAWGHSRANQIAVTKIQDQHRKTFVS